MSARLLLRGRASRGARLRTRAGFTVVELIMAIMLLTVGMIAMAGVLASSSRLQKVAQSRGEMTTLAEAKLEELRGIGSTVATDPLRAQLAVGGSYSTSVAGSLAPGRDFPSWSWSSR